jgi:hypothetical protein
MIETDSQPFVDLILAMEAWKNRKKKKEPET